MTEGYAVLWLGVLPGLLSLGLAIAWAAERIHGAIRQAAGERRERMLRRLDLLAERRLRQEPDLARAVEVNTENYLQRLEQIVLDVAGATPGIDQVLRLGDRPCPHLVGLDYAFQECVFALDVQAMVAAGQVPREVRWQRVDALTASPFAVRTLEAAYRLLAARYGVSDPALPHRPTWYLAIVPPKGGKR